MRAQALSLAVGQLNPIVNDIAGNVDRAIAFLGRHADVDLCVLPEAFVTGYPFEDLAFRPGFVAAARAGLERLVAEVARIGGPALLVGLPMAGPDRPYNAAALVHPSGMVQLAHKADLPNIGVFDEWRHFTVGAPRGPFLVKGIRVGVMICEEMWHPLIARHLAGELTDVMVAINGSPFERGKHAIRLDHARARVRDGGCPLVYANLVGGQDEIVLDGASFAVDADGTLAYQAPTFREAEFRLTLRRYGPGVGAFRIEPGEAADASDPLAHYPDDMTATYAALVLGLRDYVGKNGFPGVVLGESGGIDSAMVTAICADALGPAAVRAVTLPSRVNDDEDLRDAREAARLNGIELETIGIQPAVDALELSLEEAFAGLPRDVTEENIQARVRGTILMALSNKTGAMLVTTGNKSEMSVGYATLYGDMSGGFNPLKDVFKTDVFALGQWRNGLASPAALGFLGNAGRVVPEAILAKAPSAKLAPGQTDEDALGPYPVLDALLRGIVELDLPPRVAAAEAARTLSLDPAAPVGRSPDLGAHAEAMARLVQRAEHKRRQAPPGPKVSSKNFGRDRRYPITTGGKLD